MTEAGADSLLIYGFAAMMAHLSMSLGQTLFHRYLGHSRLGGRFFKNHIQFHHVHYAGDHVVSTHYLDPAWRGLAICFIGRGSPMTQKTTPCLAHLLRLICTVDI